MTRHSYKNGVNRVSSAVHQANIAGAQRILDRMEEMREARAAERAAAKVVTIRRFSFQDEQEKAA
jgi:hypothetical protein